MGYPDRAPGDLDTVLLERIRGNIVAHPARLNMYVWVGNAFGFRRGNWIEERLPAGPMAWWLFRQMPERAKVADDPWPVCGTTACVAGMIALDDAPEGATICGHMGGTIVLPGDGEVYQVDEWAMRRAGLTWQQSQYLFHHERTRDEVVEALAYLCAHPNANMADLVTDVGDENAVYFDWDNEKWERFMAESDRWMRDNGLDNGHRY